jgi:PRTRC genetic system protein C
MTDQTDPTAMSTSDAPRLQRIFKIGGNRIVEDNATAQLTNEQVRAVLKAAYPEVANASIRERIDGAFQVVEFLPQPGRKG